jgi:hypothetical protein
LAQSVSLDKNQGASEIPAALPVSFPSDPNLARLIAAWPTLPEPLKVGILAMVETATKQT